MMVPMTMEIQAYRFELDPNNGTRSRWRRMRGRPVRVQLGSGRVESRLEARRVVVALAVRQGRGQPRRRGGQQGLVGPITWSLPALRREWNRAKAEVAPWWAENSKEAYSSGLDALARVLSATVSERPGGGG